MRSDRRCRDSGKRRATSIGRLLLLAGAFLSVVSSSGADRPSVIPRWEPERRLTADPGDSLITFNFARSIAADESGGIHIVWYATRDGSPQVYYKRSADGGVSWGSDERLSESAAPSEHPAIAVSGSAVLVAWHGMRPGGLDVFFKRSTDGGTTWDPTIALTQAGSCAHASIAASGSKVHVVWGDTRDGHAEIYTRRSRDFGAHWESEGRLTDVPFESWVPTVAVSGQHVYVAWVDLRDGNEEEYFKHSGDGGETWGPNTRLTEEAADSWAPSVALSGTAVHLVWFDRRNAGLTHSEVEKKLDDILALVGLPAEPAPPDDPFIYYLPPFLKRVEEKILKAMRAAPGWVHGGGDPGKLEGELREFERRMRAWSTGWEIYYKHSSDGGVSWSPDIRLTNAPEVSARPSIAVSGNTLQVVWFDGRDGNSEIYTKQSGDGGTTWSGDLRLTDSLGESAHPTVAYRRGFVHVLWHDRRNGNAELFYKRRVAGPQEPRHLPFR